MDEPHGPRNGLPSNKQQELICQTPKGLGFPHLWVLYCVSPAVDLSVNQTKSLV